MHEMRKMPTAQQRANQKLAGEAIAEKSKSAKVIVDTHTLIQTNNGFLIGLPEWVVRAIQPKTVVLVEADSEKIAGPIPTKRTDPFGQCFLKDEASGEHLRYSSHRPRQFLELSTHQSPGPVRPKK